MIWNLRSCADFLQTFIVFYMLTIATQHVCAKPYRGRYVEAKCTDVATGRELLIGDAFTRPGECVRVQCLGNLSTWEDRCQTPKLQGNCTRLPSPNEYLDYPKCCPLFECKTYETNENVETEEARTYDQYGMLKKTHIVRIFLITKPLDGGNIVPGSGVKTEFEI